MSSGLEARTFICLLSLQPCVFNEFLFIYHLVLFPKYSSKVLRLVILHPDPWHTFWDERQQGSMKAVMENAKMQGG